MKYEEIILEKWVCTLNVIEEKLKNWPVYIRKNYLIAC